MRYRSIAIVFTLFCTASAFAAIPSPVIENINPHGGSVAGGTLVTITGVALNPSCGPYLISCPAPVVRFGGREAEIIERSADRLVVIAPSNSNGRMDVEITTAGGTYRLARAFAYGASDYRRVLLPVFIEGVAEGREGARWVTELYGFHHETDVARVTDDPATSPGTVAGRTAFTPVVHTTRQGFGRFLYIHEEDAETVTLNLRARDTSRELENLGTEIPVIAADEAFAGETDIALINVPTQGQYRQKIRIYDLDGEYGRTVTVRIYGDDPSTPILTRTLTTSAAAVNLDYPAYPGQVELDLELIPQLVAFDRVTVIVDTPAEGRWWAFASITNNTTQLITTVTP